MSRDYFTSLLDVCVSLSRLVPCLHHSHVPMMNPIVTTRCRQVNSKVTDGHNSPRCAKKIASSASSYLIPTSYIKRKPPSITTPCLKLDLLSAIFSSCALHPILLTRGERFAKSKTSPCHQVKSVLWQSKMDTLASSSSGPTLFPNASTCMHVSNSDRPFPNNSLRP